MASKLNWNSEVRIRSLRKTMRSDQLEESINLTVGLLSQNPLIKDFLRKIGQENNAGKGS